MPEAARPEPSRPYRWMVLFVVSLAMFGSYYAYDALSPLADLLKQQLGFSDSNIGLLQAIYSFPNIFTVVIGGLIIDRLGLRKSLMIFGALCLVGPGINAASGQLWIMAMGRLVFGMGAESLNVAVTTAMPLMSKGRRPRLSMIAIAIIVKTRLMNPKATCPSRAAPLAYPAAARIFGP